MQRNKISFKGQKIFIGIDVHKRNWSVTVLTEAGYQRTYSQNSSARELFDFLDKHFPDGEYKAVYEAGFSGFSTYYALTALGIDCIVIHAADVPTTQYENVMKSDKVDSVKMAKALRAGLLRGIYVRPLDNLDDRSVVRVRKTVQKDLTRYKSRIKHLLLSNGVDIPNEFDPRNGTKWTNAFIDWLKNDVELLSTTRYSLDILIAQLERMKVALKEVGQEIKKMSQSERYKNDYELLRSIPGIGEIVAMTLLTEINDIRRFKNERQFASYLGLIPTSHSSGDKISHGENTFRGNKTLGPMLIEASWKSIQHDSGMASAFTHYCRRMKRNEAVVRIARKLSNIIMAVLKTKQRYVPYIQYTP